MLGTTWRTASWESQGLGMRWRVTEWPSARTRAERIAAQQAEAEARAAKEVETQRQRAEYVAQRGHIAADCPAHPALPAARAFTFDDGE